MTSYFEMHTEVYLGFSECQLFIAFFSFTCWSRFLVLIFLDTICFHHCQKLARRQHKNHPYISASYPQVPFARCFTRCYSIGNSGLFGRPLYNCKQSTDETEANSLKNLVYFLSPIFIFLKIFKKIGYYYSHPKIYTNNTSNLESYLAITAEDRK